MKSIKLSFTSADPAIDVTTGTAARYEFTRDRGLTWVTWAATITPDQNNPKAILVEHIFITGDLTTAIGPEVLDLNPIVTIGGKDEPFDVRTLKVIP